LFYVIFEAIRNKDKFRNKFFTRHCEGVRTIDMNEKGLLRWLIEENGISNEKLLWCVGLDTYVFLRFLRFGAAVTLVTSLSAILLMPTYATGDNDEDGTDGFNLITVANVEKSSGRLWASLLVIFIEAFSVCFFLWREWKHLSPLRSDWLAKGGDDPSDVDQAKSGRSALVESIPARLRTPKALAAYFENLFPEQVVDANVFLVTKDLDKVLAKRQKQLLALESAVASDTASPNKAPSKTKVGAKMMCIGGKKVPAVDHFTSELAARNEEADELAGQHFEAIYEAESMDDPSSAEPGDFSKRFKKEFSSSGTVTFKSVLNKEVAVRSQISPSANEIQTEYAPAVSDFIWENACQDKQSQMGKRFISNFLWTLGILFWVIPVGFVQAIANLETLHEQLGIWVPPSDSVLYGLLSGYLPVIAMIVLMAIIPIVLNLAATKFIRVKSKQAADMYTFLWHFGFQAANLWLVLLGGSLFNQLDAFIDKPEDSIKLIAAAVPGAAQFFTNLIITQTFGGLFLELSQLVPVIVGILLGFLKKEPAKTQRELDNENTAIAINWGTLMPKFLLVMFAALTYTYIVPLVSVVAFLHFLIAYVVFRHNCLHVYHQKNQSGGIVWVTLFNMIMIMQYMALVIFMAYLSIKEGAAQAPLALIPLVFTIFFHFKVRSTFVQPYTRLSLEGARSADLLDVNETGSESAAMAGPEGRVGGANSAEEVKQQYALHVYPQPALNVAKWETAPQPYRREGDKV
jgi:hypothetical protein